MKTYKTFYWINFSLVLSFIVIEFLRGNSLLWLIVMGSAMTAQGIAVANEEKKLKEEAKLKDKGES